MSNSYRKVAVGAGVLALLLIGWWVYDRDGESESSDSDESSETGGKDGDDRDRSGADKASFFDRVRGWGKRYDPVDEHGNPIVIGVEGRVYDLVTTEPMAGVDVIFSSRGAEATVSSEADGTYSAELSPGEYHVYAIADRIYGLQDRRFHLTRNMKAARHDIGMVALAQIDGEVVDGRGASIEGATIRFESWLSRGRYKSRHLQRYTGARATAESDSSGQFEMDVVPGRVALMADIGGAIARVELDNVVPGGRRTVRIVADMSVAVSGRVVDDRGSAVAGAHVHVSSADKQGFRNSFETASGDDGSFSIEGVMAGRIRLEARAPGYGPSAYVDRNMKTGESAEVVLTLAEPASITGRVIDGDGRGMNAVKVSARRNSSTMPVLEATTDAEGYFAFDDLAPEPHYLKAVKDGEQGSSRDVLAPASDVELRITGPRSIRGTVTSSDGAPVTSFTVRVLQRHVGGVSFSGYPVPTRFHSRDGAFDLTVREAGTYLVVAGAAGYAGSEPVEVVVPDGGAGEASFTLGRGGRVTGVVTTTDGKPVARAQVGMLAGHEGHGAYTDDRGRFEIEDVTPGRRSIHASRAGYIASSVSDVAVEADTETKVELELSAASDDDDDQVELVGIGGVVVLRGEHVQLRALVTDGPAAGAGLRHGDMIRSVDGVSTKGMSLPEAGERLRGRSGTTVSLEVQRRSRVFVVKVRRDRVRAVSPTRGISV